MAAKKKEELDAMVDEAMLREIADTVGRQLAQDYAANIRGVSHVLSDEGVALHIHAAGPFQDIQMQFVPKRPAVHDIFADVNDDEL